MDGDEIFDDAVEEQWKTMILRGYTVEQINQARKRKKDKDDVRIYTYMLKQHAWDYDISCDRVDVHLKLARSLDAVGSRSDAIEMLLEATEEDHPFDSRICIALAKLLFRDDQKNLSLAVCRRIIDEYRIVPHDQLLRESDDGGYISQVDVKKAYYLAGWIYIHNDYHTRAYEVWSEGHRAIPSCQVLSKQHSKRECWDQDPSSLSTWKQQISGLLTLSEDHTKTEISDCETVLESFYVSPGVHVPPLSLFCSETQRRRLVFRTKEPLMTPEECFLVLQKVDKYHTEKLKGKWGTVRLSSVKTTDVAVEDITELHSWLLALLHCKLYPLLSVAFPILADGSTLMESSTKSSRLRVHDAFIVRYDAEIEKTLSLPEHCDTSSMSVILSLNRHEDEMDTEKENNGEYDTEWMNKIRYENKNKNKNKNKNGNGNGNGNINEKDNEIEEENDKSEKMFVPGKEGTYSGGGTWFEALAPRGLVVNADIGQAVLFAGPLRHAGFPIHRGIRNILVLFLYVEGFHYGPYLRGSALQGSSSDVMGGDEECRECHGSVNEDAVAGRRLSGCLTNSCSSSEMNDPSVRTSSSSIPSSSSPSSSSSSFSSSSAALPVTGKVSGSKSGSGSEKNGFVVYRQTVDLVSMLEENETEEEEEKKNKDKEGKNGEKENDGNGHVDNEKCSENRNDNDHD